MASSYSNTQKSSGFKPLNPSLFNNPMNSALTMKANPAPISPLKLPPVTQPKQTNAGNAFQTGGKGLVSDSVYQQIASDKPAVSPGAAVGQTPQPTGMTDNSALKSALQAHLATLKVQLANQEASEAKAKETTGGVDPKLAGSGLQGSLINSALQKGQEAAEFTRSVQKGKSDIMHDPNYSKSVAIGRAGILQEQAGQQAASLSQQAQTAAQLAGMAAPVSQFGVLTNPLTGQPISQNPGSAAFQGGEIAGQVAAGQNYTQLKSAETAAQGIAQTIKSQISQFPEFNASPLALGSALDQWINRGVVPDPRYQNIFNAISEYMQTLAPVLGVGGGSTDYKTRLANDFINPLMSGVGIQQVLDATSKLAVDKLANLKSGAMGGGVVAGGAPGVSSNRFAEDWSKP